MGTTVFTQLYTQNVFDVIFRFPERKKLCKNFVEMLKEAGDVTSHAMLTAVQDMFGHPRFDTDVIPNADRDAIDDLIGEGFDYLASTLDLSDDEDEDM